MNQSLFELSKLVFVDCGASYFPPDTWQFALSSPQSHLVLVDPNGDSLAYASQIRSKTSLIPRALFSQSGLQTLYLANTDSGSSLFPPIGRPNSLGSNPGYFLPINAKNISVSTLADELNLLNIPTIDCIKLDTQGTELAILQGLDEQRLAQLLFVEAEVSLQNPPIYKGAASFSDFSDLLCPLGFELANVRYSRSESFHQHGFGFPVECDVLYARPLHLLPSSLQQPGTLLKLLLLANLYYLYSFADQIMEKLYSFSFFSASELEACSLSQSDLRKFQAHYLSKGGLSLWHRDQ